MGRREPPALGTEGAPEAVARRLLALAGRLAQRDDVESVVVECLPGPPSRLRVLGAPPEIGGGLEFGGVPYGPPWAPPSPGRPTSQFLVVGPAAPDPETGPEPLEEPRVPYRVDSAPLPPVPLPVERGLWLAAQVHWRPSGGGRLWTALRFWIASADPSAAPAASRVAGTLLDRVVALLGPASARSLAWSRAREREWARAAWRRLRPDRRLVLEPRRAAAAALLTGWTDAPAAAEGPAHTFVFGATGSGKTRYLVDEARDRFRRGGSIVLFDVHGDLGPRFVAELTPGERARVIAIDPTGPVPPPALTFLDGRTASPEAERAHLLAALRRAGADEKGPYWGFRMDRIFDTFARIVQEEHGGLADLYELLVDPGRREAARLRARSPAVVRFLEELPAILRRNPEFLWPAAARLSRLVLAPRAAALLLPTERSLPLGPLLAAGRAIVWRLPFGELGPEGSELLVTLLAARTFLACVARGAPASGPGREITFVLDEAQAVAPVLLTEMLTDGRKFGVALLAATQVPALLPPETAATVAGSAGTHVIFRMPRAHAPSIAPWLGLAPAEALELLPNLPVGHALRVRSGPGGRCERIELPPEATAPPAGAWEALVARSSARYGPGEARPEPELDPEDERILLALLAREASAAPSTADGFVHEVGTTAAPEETLHRLARLVARRLVREPDGALELTELGRSRLGVLTPTGAARESAEHRALLLEAFRIFAHHGLRIEILRQGRYDVRLPDALFRWLGPADRQATPAELVTRLARQRASWAWRLSGGRDLFLEAEVSGADRADRVRRGLSKGREARAFVLFLVADARRAAKVRRALGPAFPRDATVWTLVRAQRVRAAMPAGRPDERSSPPNA